MPDIRFRILVGLAALATTAAAPVPTDVAACVRYDTQTSDQIATCLQKLIDRADAELNDRYHRAMTSLDPRSKALLQTSQRQWIAFRNADIAANNGPWREAKGRGLERRMDAMTNTITALRERRDEIGRLYLGGEPTGRLWQ